MQEQIQIAGVILVQGWSGNEIRIDVLDGDQRQIGGSRPSVISSASVSKPGAYEISVPKGKRKTLDWCLCRSKWGWSSW